MNNLTIAAAKTRVRIPDVWRHFNLPGEPRKACKSPFRQDRKPSFSVNEDGTLFNDFATGDAGDVVDFFQRVSGLSRKDACIKFVELAGGSGTSAPCAVPQHFPKPAKADPGFLGFQAGTPEQLRQVAALRRISTEAAILANARGLLRFATIKACAAWIITDAARLNAQARRMDGGLWPHLAGAPKAYTLPGAWASWPIGILEGRDFPKIALVEGGPDLLAAFHFIICAGKEATCAPVAMMGARQRIHVDALPLFAGKHIRIFGHDDEDGRAAVISWAAKLETVGADVDAFNFCGLRQVNESAVKDLNDCTNLHADDFESDRTLWTLIP